MPKFRVTLERTVTTEHVLFVEAPSEDQLDEWLDDHVDDFDSDGLLELAQANSLETVQDESLEVTHVVPMGGDVEVDLSIKEDEP